jgi:hypothetical protein
VPPGGAPIASAALSLTGLPIRLVPPTDPFAPEALENTLLTFVVVSGVEILEATASLVGDDHAADLAAGAVIDDGRALIDLGGLRPLTRIDFTKGVANAASKLMVQLGGVWHRPEPAGATDFDAYVPNTPFPELITEKALLANVGSVRTVESITFPSNVALRLTDGGVPFFFLRGNLRRDPVRVPDFGEQLALAVRGCEPVDGACSIDLVAHSDTFGTISVDAARAACRVVHNGLDGLTFDDRTRGIPPGATARLDLPVPDGLVVPDGRPAVSTVSLGLVALGFGPAFAPAIVHHGAVVSAEFQVAQAVDFDEPVTTSAVYLYLARRTPKATLTVELRADADGEPRGAVLASASVDAAGLPDGGFGWLAAPLTAPQAAPLVVEAGTRLWIALTSGAGEIEWGGDDVADGRLATQFSADRGNTWRPHPMTAGFLFVQTLPDPAAPLTLTLAVGGHEQSVAYDPSAFPLTLDSASPLARGINAAFVTATGGDPGTPLPATISLDLGADSPRPLQVSLTQFDVTYVQTQALATGLVLEGDRSRAASVARARFTRADVAQAGC